MILPVILTIQKIFSLTIPGNQCLLALLVIIPQLDFFPFRMGNHGSFFIQDIGVAIVALIMPSYPLLNFFDTEKSRHRADHRILPEYRKDDCHCRSRVIAVRSEGIKRRSDKGPFFLQYPLEPPTLGPDRFFAAYPGRLRSVRNFLNHKIVEVIILCETFQDIVLLPDRVEASDFTGLRHLADYRVHRFVK